MKLKILLLLALVIPFAAVAQKIKEKQENKPSVSNTIQSKVSSLQKFEGFFEFYYNEKQDKILLVIDKFDTEFLYINSLSAGIGSNDIGLDRGQLGSERIVKFEKRGSKVLLIEPNYRYRAITTSDDEKRAVEEAFAQSVLWGFKVEADENGKVLVDASDFFLQDTHDVIGRLKNTQQGTYTVDKSRSAFYVPRIKNFPKNSEFEVILTFTGTPAGAFIRSVTPTPSAITVRQHHSFVELPDSNFQPRAFDPRAGYFSTSYYDYATPISEPIEKRLITRHRLRKRDPAAALSEPVQPIIYYLDRGTPEPIRSALLEGARWWNQAFEAAGYKDAFRVEMMPEGADPMDVRYNVIQWVHRSTRGWSYGASVTDPRTGEILKGHVTLGSLRVRQDYLIAEGLLAPYEEGKPVSQQMEQMALARLRQLSAHEVGHTLGLAHAYSSSAENFASVMDYPHPVANVVNGKIDLTHAYDDKIGAWDKVAIAYGYQDFPAGASEREALNAIIQNSISQGLTFLSDQDARPAGGAHPYTHLWDNGKDPAEELSRVMQVRTIALKNFGVKNIKPEVPMAMLEEALVPIYFFHRYQAEATVKIVGGLEYRYALRGDGQPITSIVNGVQQTKALDALLKTIAPSALMLPEDLLRMIPPRPIGYARHREVIKVRTELTFDPLAAAEAAADLTISLLLHPARAGRLVEYHGRDPRNPSLEFVLDRLINATFKSDPKSGLEGGVQMTVNDVFLQNIIKLARSKEASAQVRAIGYFKIDQLRTWLKEALKVASDEGWKAHYTYAMAQLEKFRENPDQYQEEVILSAPPGQPIGQFDHDYCGQN